MWYKDYKKQSYRINWQAVDAQGLKAAWLIDTPVSKFYDKCGDMVLKSPHPYIPYCNHFSCMDSLYGVSTPVCQSSVYYIDSNINRILETSSGNNGYNREVELLSNFTESYSIFARFYYHPSFYAAGGTGILATFSNGPDDMPASIFVDGSGFKFTADNGLHYASGTIHLPEGWYDVWGIFDSGATINTRLIVNGEEQHGAYTPAPIRPVGRDFVVAGDKGTGNNYWGTFSEIRFYNWPVPLGMAQYVYEPSNVNSLYRLPEDEVFSSISETSSTLYLPSRSGIDDNWTLFLKAPEGINKGSPLYTAGPIPWSGGTSLYIHHDRYDSNQAKLVINSADTTRGYSFTTGQSGQAIHLNGDGWLESSATTTDLRFDTDTTITGWVKLSSVNAGNNGVTQDIISYPGSPGVFTIYHTRSLGASIIGCASQYGSVVTIDMIHAEQWIFFAYRYDYTLKRECFQISTPSGDYNCGAFSYSVNRTPSTSKLYIGSTSGNNIVSAGTEIDQLHIWHRKLSDVEIAQVQTEKF